MGESASCRLFSSRWAARVSSVFDLSVVCSFRVGKNRRFASRKDGESELCPKLLRGMKKIDRLAGKICVLPWADEAKSLLFSETLTAVRDFISRGPFF